MIRFEKVTKTFPLGNVALKDISFAIEPGEMITITGKSGAGKTTILKLLIKEISPTEGEIIVDDLNINKIKPRDLPKLRRTIGAVFQDFKILEDQTIAENIGLILELAGKDNKEISKRVNEVLELVKLPEKANLFPRQLSGGELQRAAIARALAIKPNIIFADEPTGNLDEDTSRDIINLLNQIKESGATVIIATHDPLVMKSVSGRVFHLEAGVLVEIKRKS